VTGVQPAADATVTRDGFLGGRLRLWQPRDGYRAGIDPVLLAAAVRARPGQSVLELGCGAGAAILCLAARVPGLRLCGLEVQARYADLARRNARDNGMELDVVVGDLASMPGVLKARQFDHVIANPPYLDRTASSPARDPGRDRALAGDTPLSAWVDAATRRLVPGGAAWFILRADRLPELLGAADARLGGASVLPVVPRVGRVAKLVLVHAVKGARRPFRLLAPVVLHRGARHAGDADDYRAAISRILRDAAPLEFPE